MKKLIVSIALVLGGLSSIFAHEGPKDQPLLSMRISGIIAADLEIQRNFAKDAIHITAPSFDAADIEINGNMQAADAASTIRIAMPDFKQADAEMMMEQ